MLSRKFPVALILAWAGLFAGASSAAPVNILGLDDMSCGAWVKSGTDKDQRALYVAWIRGVLTGHNYARPGQQVSTISSGTVEMNVSRYCSSNPQGAISDAAFRLADQFSGRNEPIRK